MRFSWSTVEEEEEEKRKEEEEKREEEEEEQLQNCVYVCMHACTCVCML